MLLGQIASAQLTRPRVLAIRVDFGEEQPAVDGEDYHAIADRISRIRHDAPPAFARTFATSQFLGRHVFAFRVGQQFARVGQQQFAIAAIGADCAHPQRGHEVFGAIGTQEQRTCAIADRLRRPGSAAGEAQGAGLEPGKFSYRL
jgi:hypothetical protein